jgi:hypothetical protein
VVRAGSTIATVGASLRISAVPIGVGLRALRRRIIFETLIVRANALEKIFAQFFGLLDHFRLRPRNVQIHRFIRLLACWVFHESWASAFDLDTAARLCLDMLDICTTLAYNLCTQVEAWDVLHVEYDALFRPFALMVLALCRTHRLEAYPTKLISLHGVLITTSEASFVDQVGKLLLHEFFDLGNGFF